MKINDWYNLLGIDFQRHNLSDWVPRFYQISPAKNWNPVPQPLSGLSYFLVRHCADTTFFLGHDLYIDTVYLPQSDRQTDWFGRSQPFKHCRGFGKNVQKHFSPQIIQILGHKFPRAPSFPAMHSVPCRTSTTTIHAKCSLPGLTMGLCLSLFSTSTHDSLHLRFGGKFSEAGFKWQPHGTQ